MSKHSCNFCKHTAAFFFSAITQVSRVYRHADKLKSDIDAGAKDYRALMDRHDAQFVRAEQAEGE